MLMATFILVTGKKIKLMGMGFIVILMVHVMKVIGKMIDKTVTVLRHGLMALSTKEIINKERNTEQVLFSGQMAVLTQDNLLTTTLKAKVSTFGQI